MVFEYTKKLFLKDKLLPKLLRKLAHHTSGVFTWMKMQLQQGGSYSPLSVTWFAISLDDVRMRQHRYTHMYTEAPYFSHPFAKSNLLRPFYDSLTKLWSMEITFPWLDIPLSRSSRPTWGHKAKPRRMPMTDRSCGSSESAAFQRVKAWHISHKCSLNSLSF